MVCIAIYYFIVILLATLAVSLIHPFPYCPLQDSLLLPDTRPLQINSPTTPNVGRDAALCHAAKEKRLRVWIDAEQQDLQPTIDDRTLLLMREFNRDGQAFMYNTFQAYLKVTPKNILKYLRIA